MAEHPDDSERRFNQTYHGCWLPVFRLALAWTNEWGAAEDLAQEAFMRLWARRDQVDWNDSILPWLLVTTRHLATDRFRRLRRAVRMPSISEPPLDGQPRLRWLDVQRAFSGLSPQERAALTMVSIGGLDYEQAAQVLGTTAAALRAAASRGRRKLEEA
jgi:RNA polymerase sigma-70 factor (ECF subfamily)